MQTLGRSVVKGNKPNVLLGLDQNGNEVGSSYFWVSLAWTDNTSGVYRAPKSVLSITRNTVSPYRLPGLPPLAYCHKWCPTGSNAVRQSYSGAGMRIWRKPMQSCNGTDTVPEMGLRGPARKRAHFQKVFDHERTCKTDLGGNADGG